MKREILINGGVEKTSLLWNLYKFFRDAYMKELKNNWDYKEEDDKARFLGGMQNQIRIRFGDGLSSIINERDAAGNLIQIKDCELMVHFFDTPGIDDPRELQNSFSVICKL